MIVLLSPAKKLLSFSEPYHDVTTQPLFGAKTHELVSIMKSKSVQDIAQLMDLSQELAVLNFERFQSFTMVSTTSNSYPALWLFRGDVYQSLQADTWDQKTITYAINHLKILSGLYGVLNPLDLVQAYRLEMGIKLANPLGINLYQFWSETVTNYLNNQLLSHSNPCIINLASTEYAKVINMKQLNAPFIEINFYEQKNGQTKMIGIYAKKARGLMAKFLMQNQIDDLKNIREFNDSGYKYCATSSSEFKINFIRSH